MKLKVNKSESYNWSIVVDEKELRRLDEIIKNIFTDSRETTILNLKYNIKCSDGSLIETDDVNEVISEENSKNRQIEYIKVYAENPESSNKLSISLGGGKYSFEKNVYYSISGDTRDWVYLTASKIEERIKNLKTWYSIIPKIDSAWIVFIFIILIQIYVASYPKKDVEVTPKAILIFLVAIVVVYIVYKLIKKADHYLFPSVVFRLGDGIKRHDDVVKLRGQIFWTILVSFIISLVAGLTIFLYTS